MEAADLKAEILATVREVFSRSVLELPDAVAGRVSERLAEKAAASAVPAPPGDLAPPAAVSPEEDTRAVAAAQARLRDLQEESQKAQVEFETRLEALRAQDARFDALRTGVATAQIAAEAAEERRAAAESDATRLKAESASLEATLAEARSLVAQAEPVKRQQDELEAQSLALETRRSIIETQRADIEKQRQALESQRAEFEGYRKSGEEARRQSEKLWPAWLCAGDLAPWRTRLESGLAGSAASPAAALLFAAVHTYNAALRDPDPKSLLDTLRDVGRRLYAWLRDGDFADADAAGAAEQWAAAINAECEGRGEVEVPIPGNAASNQWMIFQPRGGSSPDVISVRSWCVRDAQQRPVHRAEVSV